MILRSADAETHSSPLASPLPVHAQAGRFSSVVGRIGALEARLARNEAEINAAQSLRYRVFAEEMKAALPLEAEMSRRDFDRFDPVCDHLIVVDTALEGKEQVIGACRLLRQDVARRNNGFYSDGEFDIGELLARHPDKNFMELGRSCVLPEYRTRRTAELLWQGTWAYALKHNIDVMFGCASFRGIVPEEHALALSFLHHTSRAKAEWWVRAYPELYRTMDLMPVEAVNPRRAILAMPPLLKGYLRIGAMFGDGAVVDADFGTTDVLVVLPTIAISGRYINYYGADAGRFRRIDFDDARI